MTVPILMTASYLISLALGVMCLVLWNRQRRFSKPFDPKVMVYGKKLFGSGHHGWVTSFDLSRFGMYGTPTLSEFPKQGAVEPLSQVRKFADRMKHAGYYTMVVRVVHPEHWMEADNG